MLIAISGMVATGKSTTASLVAARLGVKVLLEDVDELPGYKKWLMQEGSCFEAQKAFLRRAFNLQQVASIRGGVQERTVQENYEVFVRYYYETGRLSSHEFRSLTSIYAAMCREVRAPDFLVHLSAPVPVLLLRAARRGRLDDTFVTESELFAMRPYYERMLSKWRLCPFTIIDSSEKDKYFVSDMIVTEARKGVLAERARAGY